MQRDLGLSVGAEIRSTQPLLSSNTVEWAVAWSIVILYIILSSSNIDQSGIKSCKDCDREV
jgi:hypothetical protein